MKNPFKKTVKKDIKSVIQKMDANQLEKVVGGVTASTPPISIQDESKGFSSLIR